MEEGGEAPKESLFQRLRNRVGRRQETPEPEPVSGELSGTRSDEEIKQKAEEIKQKTEGQPTVEERTEELQDEFSTTPQMRLRQVTQPTRELKPEPQPTPPPTETAKPIEAKVKPGFREAYLLQPPLDSQPMFQAGPRGVQERVVVPETLPDVGNKVLLIEVQLRDSPAYYRPTRIKGLKGLNEPGSLQNTRLKQELGFSAESNPFFVDFVSKREREKMEDEGTAAKFTIEQLKEYAEKKASEKPVETPKETREEIAAKITQ